ncbi:hypothetical protein Tco_0899141, partial [Tanacetum coccineum]
MENGFWSYYTFTSYGLDEKYLGLIIVTVESIAGVKEAILMVVVEEQVLGSTLLLVFLILLLLGCRTSPAPFVLKRFIAGIEELTKCKASASNLRRIQVKDIVKEVKDYLKTYSSAGMDIS